MRDADEAGDEPLSAIALDAVDCLPSTREKLRESQRRLATLINNLPGLAYRCPVRDRGIEEYASDGIEVLTGYPASDFVSKRVDWRTLIHPEDADYVNAEIARGFAERRPHSIIFRLIHRSGRIVWIQDRGQGVYGPDGEVEYVEGFVGDLTEQKQIEAALRDSEERLRSVLDAASDGVWEWNAPDKMNSSPRWLEKLGYAPEETPCTVGFLLSIVHPDDVPRVQAAIKAHWRDKTPRYECEYRMRTQSGAWLWCQSRGRVVARDDSGQPIRMVGTFIDISAQKRAEAALAASEALNRTVVDGSADGIRLLDCNGNLLFMNGAVLRASEIEDFATVKGRPWLDLWPEESHAAVGEALAAARRGEVARFVAVCPTLKGEALWLDVLITPVLGGDGRPEKLVVVSRDVTEQKRLEGELADRERALRAMLDAQPECVQVVAPDGKLIDINPAGLAMIEAKSRAEVLGADPARFVAASHLEAFRSLHDKVLAGTSRDDQPHEFEIIGLRGTRRLVESRFVPLRDNQDRIWAVLSVMRDITEKKHAEERVRWMANHDPLTALPNRAFFQQRLQEALRHADTEGSKVGLLLLDLDDFKQINDTLGHDAGDALLSEVASRLSAVIRGSDTVARLGGDEFAIILPNLDSSAALAKPIGAIMAALHEPFPFAGKLLDCHASIGATLYPDHDTDPVDLLKNADIALYAAKAAGRSKVAQYSVEMRRKIHNRIMISQQVRAALADDRILIFYQPKVSMASGALVGFEALLRWRDPALGIRRPGTISTAFEDTELAAALSDRMLDKVIGDMRDWLRQGVPFKNVAVNASAAEFHRGNFAERILERLHAAGVPPHCLEIEVTETVFLGHGAEVVGQALRTLNEAGVTIALDDFGTGYASLSHLKRFPVDTIKIDQSFVRDLAYDPDNASIVRAVITLGQSLGMQVVAEGVEDPQQAAYLCEQGCDIGQGYLFSAPIISSEIPRLIARMPRVPRGIARPSGNFASHHLLQPHL